MDVTYCCCKCGVDILITTCEEYKHNTCENCSVKAILAEVGQLSQEMKYTNNCLLEVNP